VQEKKNRNPVQDCVHPLAAWCEMNGYAEAAGLDEGGLMQGRWNEAAFAQEYGIEMRDT
jgi:hypothetical protein